MTIQKKSLISSLNTTKKAIVASSPVEAPTASEKPVKLARPAVQRLARPAVAAKFARPAVAAKFARPAVAAKFAKI